MCSIISGKRMRQASGGGEFVIVRCENKMWEILKGKGHVMSRNGKYCCIYHPYHYMGLETPVSILEGDLMGIGTHSECRQVSVLAGVARGISRQDGTHSPWPSP